MKFRVSDGYSAAIEFEAANEVQFVDRCSLAICELHRAKIPHYQTRNLESAAKFNRLQLHTKTALDKSARQWTWVYRSGYFATVTAADLFRGAGPKLWETAQYTQRHGAMLSRFLGGVSTWLNGELKPQAPTLRLV